MNLGSTKQKLLAKTYIQRFKISRKYDVWLFYANFTGLYVSSKCRSTFTLNKILVIVFPKLLIYICKCFIVFPPFLKPNICIIFLCTNTNIGGKLHVFDHLVEQVVLSLQITHVWNIRLSLTVMVLFVPFCLAIFYVVDKCIDHITLTLLIIICLNNKWGYCLNFQYTSREIQ